MRKRYCAIADGFFAMKNNLFCAPDANRVSTAGFARLDARLALAAGSR